MSASLPAPIPWPPVERSPRREGRRPGRSRQGGAMSESGSSAATRRQVLQYGSAAAVMPGLAAAGATRTSAATAASAVVDHGETVSPFPHVWERVVGGDW